MTLQPNPHHRTHSVLRLTLAFVVAATLLCAPASAQTEPDSQGPIVAGDEAQQILDFAKRLYRYAVVPGAAIAIVRGDETILLDGIGYAEIATGRQVTPDTVFYIASSTKSFTGLASALLDLRGEWDLDASLSAALPEATFHEAVDATSITLRDLLTHTHGISSDGPLPFRAAYSGAGKPLEMLELVAHHGAREEGKGFRYTNLGYNVLNLVMHRRLDASWKVVLNREVLSPLGMTSTTGNVSEIDPQRLARPYRFEAMGFTEIHYGKSDVNMHAAGGLVTTATDLARWLEANLNEGRIGGEQALPKEAFAQAHRAQAQQDSASGEFLRTGYALGWNTGTIYEQPQLHHFGGFAGFHAHVSFLPEADLGVAILVNESSAGNIFARFLASYAYDVLLGRPDVEARTEKRLATLLDEADQARAMIAADRRRRAARDQNLPHPRSAYTGTFRNPEYGTVEMTLDGEELEARMGPLYSAVEVYDAAKNALRVELLGGGTVLVYRFDDEGNALSFAQGPVVFERME